SRKVDLALTDIRANLGDEYDLIAIAAFLHPLADDPFRFSAGIARYPARIGIGGIDGVEASVDKAVEQVERGLLVGGPAEDVTAQNQRRDGKVGATETAFLQFNTPSSGWGAGAGRDMPMPL